MAVGGTCCSRIDEGAWKTQIVEVNVILYMACSVCDCALFSSYHVGQPRSGTTASDVCSYLRHVFALKQGDSDDAQRSILNMLCFNITMNLVLLGFYGNTTE